MLFRLALPLSVRKGGRVGPLLDGVANMVAKRWVGSELVKSGKCTESKTTRHEGNKRHDVFGRLHASRGLLEEPSSMHV